MMHGQTQIIAVMRLTWIQDLLGFCHRVGWSSPFSWVYSVALRNVCVNTLTQSVAVCVCPSARFVRSGLRLKWYDRCETEDIILLVSALYNLYFI
jgi:hypothetical protein